MANIHIDIVDGHTGRYTSKGWENVTRIAKVAGLTGDGDAKITAAITALIGSADCGDIGEPHPAIPELAIVAMTPTAITPSAVEVRIEYGLEEVGDDPDSDNIDIEVGSALQQVETNKDAAGNAITLTYTYPAEYAPDARKAGQAITQGALVSKDETTISLVITRTESTRPTAKAREWTGKVNSVAWSMDPAAAVGTWKVRSIVGRSANNGRTWKVTYTFEWRAGGWASKALFINPDDGKPPTDLVEDTGTKTIDPPSGEFDSLIAAAGS
jgi:hypothetical protein